MTKIPTYPEILKKRGGSLMISVPPSVIKMKKLHEGSEVNVTLELIEDCEED